MGDEDCRLAKRADTLRASLSRDPMGDRSSSCSPGLRLLSRLVSVVAALFVLSVTGRASATANLAVPMCGEHNESIAAPPIFRSLVDGGSIRATPCQAPSGFAVGQDAPAPSERSVVVYERPERVLAFGVLSMAQTDSSRLSIARASLAPERPGFAGTLFRPPRT